MSPKGPPIPRPIPSTSTMFQASSAWASVRTFFPCPSALSLALCPSFCLGLPSGLSPTDNVSLIWSFFIGFGGYVCGFDFFSPLPPKVDFWGYFGVTQICCPLLWLLLPFLYLNFIDLSPLPYCTSPLQDKFNGFITFLLPKFSSFWGGSAQEPLQGHTQS